MSDETTKASSRKTILVAEDDDSMRRFLEIALKRDNFDTLLARDGLEALEIALGNDIDAIVTDAVMPNLTGFDLCRILRQDPAKKHIPIILLTGFGMTTEDEFSAGCQADAFLTKGTNLSEMLAQTLSKLFADAG